MRYRLLVWMWSCALLLLFLRAPVDAKVTGPLTETITDYDKLTYEPVLGRQRRDLHSGDAPVELAFHAHSRKFHLLLVPNSDILVPGATLEIDGRREPLRIPEAVKGSLVGDPRSHVYGSIIDGVFRGAIHMSTGEGWYVEPTDYFFPTPQPFHSIIYNDSHVQWPKRFKRSAPLSPCGLSSSEVSDTLLRYKAHPGRSRHAHHHPADAYLPRQKRATTDKPKVCSLFMQSDTLLWQETLKLPSVKNDETRAKTEITNLFTHHVSAASHIYSNTLFSTHDNKYRYSGIQFKVNRIKINTTADCQGENAKLNKFCNPNIDVTNFLNLHAYNNHSEHCLAYLFTYRDFHGGTLGLAWVGTVDQNGGICEEHRQYDDQQPGRQAWKSLNTGIVTLINYGRRIAAKVSYLTFAHEMGHNFGANHDDGLTPSRPECVPQTEEGYYIMFSSATTGDKANNNKFSPCSKANVALLLNAVLEGRGNKRNCLSDSSDSSFCGNNLKEDGEECDCGYDTECTDTCCNPKLTNGDNSKACTVKAGKTCSPSGNPCCTTACDYASSSRVCRSETDCTLTTLCTGSNDTCPEPVPRRDNTTCQDSTKLCLRGECIRSVCALIGYEECFKIREQDPNDDSSMCYLGCRKSNVSECISTLEVARKPSLSPEMHSMLVRLNKTEAGVQLQSGSPCDNYRGYCDNHNRCRRVDSKGPLGRLQELLFSPQTLESIRQWIVTHWYYVILICIGVIVFMGLFVKICSVHTPSSNPARPAARKLTLRRPSRRPQRSQHPPGQVPLGAYSYNNGGDGPAPSRTTGLIGVPSSVNEPPPPYYSMVQRKIKFLLIRDCNR